MPQIVFIQHDGTRQDIDAEVGKSLMQTALDNLVPGIIGDCGGNCSCATCHAYIDDAWVEKLEPPNDEEKMMVEGAARLQTNSRLICQLHVRPEFDGLIVHVPESQF
jgi:2Fe-2S ferredoxin